MGVIALNCLKTSRNTFPINEWKTVSAGGSYRDNAKTLKADDYARYKKRVGLGRRRAIVPKLNIWLIKKANPIPRQTIEEFYSCMLKWKEETKVISSMTEILLNRHYQRIIGLGPVVIPLVLKELRDFGGPWFAALNALTGENLITQEDAGNMNKIREKWLTWGKKNNYL
jgi:hypothetical protein